ncbi:MAG: CHAT domain-containing protein [Rhodothermales bacterium]
MDYLDFELQLSAGLEGGYRVAVLRSPAGEVQTNMNIPFKQEEFAMRLQALKNTRNSEGANRNFMVPHKSLITIGGVSREMDAPKHLGKDLFEALLPLETRAVYRTSLSEARKQGKGLRLRLRVDAPELAVLPWEYLYDETEGDFFCLSTETPLTRYLEVGRGQEPLRVKPPLRILGVVASPSGVGKLDVKGEKRLMNEAIHQVTQRGFAELTWLEGQTWRDLQTAMRNGPWHIFHFIGHGGFDESLGEGLIILADENGAPHRLGATQLGRLLSGHPSMRMAVLNACEGARASDSDLFSSTGSVLIRRGIPATVSMQYEISDRAALEFSRTFYETIAEGLPVDTAVKEARKSISMALSNTSEWATPVLHMRPANGRLFTLDVAGALFGVQPPRQQQEIEKPASLERQQATPEPSPAQQGAFEKQDQRGFGILLRKVRLFWIEGVLKNSLHRSTLIKLGLDAMPAMVDGPFGSLPMSSAQTIGSVFEEMGGSLLILGEPGAGKTTLLLTLAQDLLNISERSPMRACPVVLNLSSWSGFDGTLADWLSVELSTKYQIPKKIGRNWIETSRILFLLDGLDEVHTEQRSACVEAINAYIETTGISSLVVCCRFKEYLGLPTRLILNGAVRLRQLSREQVLSYVADAGDILAGLQSALERDSSLLMLAETPFMLSMMAQTYQGVSMNEPAFNEYTTIESHRQQLMQAYVERQFRLGAASGKTHG